MPFESGPNDALDFLKRSVDDSVSKLDVSERKRALDIGCAVGGSSFYLAQHFDQVLGIDFSQAFVDAANRILASGNIQYQATIQGDSTTEHAFPLPSHLYERKDRISFQQGDACALNATELGGEFDFILASNLLCRLPDPVAFLTRLPSLVTPGGVVALISPYSWLEEYTRKDRWTSFDRIQQLLDKEFELIHRENYPFLIREHERKYQYGVSDGCVWQRRQK